MRTAPTTFQQAKSSGNLRGSKEAYALAKEGTYKETYDEPDLSIEPKFNLTRAQLSELSQALAYEGICEQRTLKYKRGLDMVLDIMRYAAEEAFGFLPPDEKIWKSIHNKDLPKRFRAFLWKALHNAHKVGEHWENIPNWEHRSVCKHCKQSVTDNLEHIFFACEVIGQKQIWQLVKAIWE